MNKEVSKYIGSHCANYDRDGMCLLATSSAGSRLCPFFYDIGVKCKYAEKAVLPGDAKIDALYMAGKESSVQLDECAECAVPLRKKNNANKYCATCAIEVRRRRQRKYKAGQRLDFYNSGE